MRLHAQTATIENGFVHLPKEAHWLADYLSELTTFPAGRHDDQVDSTAQALAWDGVLRQPDYPVDQEVRQVRSNGEIKWQGKLVYINCALAGEPVGLAENAAGWTVSYDPIVLGAIAHGGARLRKPEPAGCGLVDNTAPCPQGPQPRQQQHRA